MQCSNCGSFKTGETNVPRNLFFAGIGGFLFSFFITFSPFWIMLFSLLTFIALVALCVNRQWNFVMYTGLIFTFIFFFLISTNANPLVVTGLIAGILLFIIGGLNRHNTASALFKCKSCGYKWE